MPQLCGKLTDKDNVAIAVHDISIGTEIRPGVITNTDIPQAYKTVLCDISKGGEVIWCAVRVSLPAEWDWKYL